MHSCSFASTIKNVILGKFPIHTQGFCTAFFFIQHNGQMPPMGGSHSWFSLVLLHFLYYISRQRFHLATELDPKEPGAAACWKYFSWELGILLNFLIFWSFIKKNLSRFQILSFSSLSLFENLLFCFKESHTMREQNKCVFEKLAKVWKAKFGVDLKSNINSDWGGGRSKVCS